MNKVILIVCIVALALSAQVYLVSPAYAGKPSPPTGEKLPWGVDRIDADRVWDKDPADLNVDPGANTGLGIRVAVLDTGVSYHPDLNVTNGRNFVDLLPDESDNNYHNDIDGHGTAIAGIIAAVDNEEGYIGVGPGIEIYAVRFIKYKGGPVAPDVGTNYADPASYRYTDLYEAMRWCIDNNMQVISISFGIWTVKDASITAVAPLHDPNFYRLIKEAYNKGIVIVSAAGNGVGVTNGNGRSIKTYDNPPLDGLPFITSLDYDFPVSYPEVITVSATGIRTLKGKPGERQTVDYFPAFSNFGPKIDLAAPGVAVEVPTKSGGYGLFSGTSGAAPHVAAVAALVLKQMGETDPRPGLPESVRTRLKDKAEILSNLTSDQQGAGLVDAENAVLGSWPAPSRQPKLSVTWGEIKIK